MLLFRENFACLLYLFLSFKTLRTSLLSLLFIIKIPSFALLFQNFEPYFIPTFLMEGTWKPGHGTTPHLGWSSCIMRMTDRFVAIPFAVIRYKKKRFATIRNSVLSWLAQSAIWNRPLHISQKKQNGAVSTRFKTLNEAFFGENEIVKLNHNFIYTLLLLDL